MTIVTVDMPVSSNAITGRRCADNAVSHAFGATKCGTHSPSVQRPGKLGYELTTAFKVAGYAIATTDNQPGSIKRLIEVYPHPALLHLLSDKCRLPYKTSKTTTYWPRTSVSDRIRKLLEVYNRILAALAVEITDIHLPLPPAENCPSLSSLKRYEDAIDALVCAWVGCRYVDGQATPFGDTTAAIWIPDAKTMTAANPCTAS